MDWIESHKAVLWHRKTGRLMRALGISRIEAVGYLHAFWWWCTDNAPDGVLDTIDHEDIADGALWEGEPGAFLEGLIRAGWVDVTDGGRYVHDWYEHCGKLIERRKADAKRKRDGRLGIVHETSDGHPPDGARTLPYPTVPNPTVPELNTKQTSTTGKTEPADNDAPEGAEDGGLSAFVTDVITEYPRNKDNRKPTRTIATEALKKIPARDRPVVLLALKHYVVSDSVKRGFVMDIRRFAKEWQTYQEPAGGKTNGAHKQNAATSSGTHTAGSPGSGWAGVISGADLERQKQKDAAFERRISRNQGDHEAGVPHP